jgi:hypothetical protein
MVDRIDGKPVMLDQISILDAEFKLLKTVVSLPQYTPPPPPQPINIGAVYGPELVLCPIGQDRGVYAISSEYKCHVINTLGTISHIFTKDESPQPFSKKEKERIINSFKKSIERSGSDTKFTADFPKHKPLFHAILNDDKGRIYIQKYQIIPTGDRVLNYDLFSEEGYYLHEVKIPIFPQVIKNGYVYAAEPNPDTGYIEVRRYKIKNWEQIKSGIN